MEWTILDTPDDVAVHACKRIIAASEKAITERGEFHLVLTGGNTPQKTYALLAESDCQWACWHIWFGDERCLPDGDPQRNSVMAEQTLTGRVAIPSSQMHVIPAEIGPELAADFYAGLLKDVDLFDMVLLGMGEDGHVASLFPGQVHSSGITVVPVHDSPKPPPERVSLSADRLSRNRQLLFMITGKTKAEAVNRWRDSQPLPVSEIRSQGLIEVIADKDACSL